MGYRISGEENGPHSGLLLPLNFLLSYMKVLDVLSQETVARGLHYAFFLGGGMKIIEENLEFCNP